MHSIMAMNIKGYNMGILKKIWYWLSVDVTKGSQKSGEDFILKDKAKEWEEYKARKLEEISITKEEVKSIKQEISKYAIGGYIKNVERYVAPEEFYRREGTKIKGGVNSPPTTPRPNFAPPPQNPTRDFKREADEHFRQQQARREADDNFILGAIVGGVVADSLNEDNSHKAIETEHIEPVYLFVNSEGGNNGGHSSSSDSDYIPSSSSSYDSGSYSSSYDSGNNSSCSCDSGC